MRACVHLVLARLSDFKLDVVNALTHPHARTRTPTVTRTPAHTHAHSTPSTNSPHPLDFPNLSCSCHGPSAAHVIWIHLCVPCSVYHFHSMLPDESLRFPTEEELGTPSAIMDTLSAAMHLPLGVATANTVPPFFREAELKAINWAR